jgi:predicted nucleic acid-binding protein
MLFDTDVLIWFLRGDTLAARLIDSERNRNVSIVSFMELIQGAKTRREATAIRRFLRDLAFSLIPVDEAISYLAASLMEEHSQSNGLQVADAFIAATARESADVLATENVRHFRGIAGVRLKPFRPGRLSSKHDSL